MKSIRTLIGTLALVALGAFTTSCVDATAPSSGSTPSQSDLSSSLLGGGGLIQIIDTTVTVVQRLVPLAGDVTRSEVIGPDGGSIAIPETGFRLDIPKNTLVTPTTITVTAVAGSSVAYEFEPHGLQFNKRLTFSQDLGITSSVLNLLGTRFVGGYFQSRDEISPSGSAFVHEIVPANVDLLSGTVQFPIKHFSGYLVAVD
jgi:hypothetical protein